MTSVEDQLKKARAQIEQGEKKAGAKLLSKAADTLAASGENSRAAEVYEEVAVLFRDMYRADDCFAAFDNAILMLFRQGINPEVNKELVRVSTTAARIAEDATEYKTAADFYFRALDFADTPELKQDLNFRAAESLEKLAADREEEGNLEEAVSLLKKVGRLFYSAGDDELGERIYDRAVKLALRWAETARKGGDLIAAGNALAEAAQIMQKIESPEAPRLMIDAGELYEQVGLLEKAGNIYDAAQEAYKLQRNTSARRTAMTKAAQAYLGMEGKPEIVAPLLMKAGSLFKELRQDVKAKWAYKRANELFEELAKKAKVDGDLHSEKIYLRFRAFCLREWGHQDDADRLYSEVVEYFLNQAREEETSQNKELQAVSLEEAADVLWEAGREEEAQTHMEKALELYAKLADDLHENDQSDDASRFYSRAADCAEKLGDSERSSKFHATASESALQAAEFYDEAGIVELVTIWTRTAATEALRTKSTEMIEKAIELLRKSAQGFEEIHEPREAFEDLFTIFESLFLHYPDSREKISEVLGNVQRLSREIGDVTLAALNSIIQSLDRGNHNAATLVLQENEEELMRKKDRLIRLIDQSRAVRIQERGKRTGRTHWAYR